MVLSDEAKALKEYNKKLSQTGSLYSKEVAKQVEKDVASGAAPEIVRKSRSKSSSQSLKEYNKQLAEEGSLYSESVGKQVEQDIAAGETPFNPVTSIAQRRVDKEYQTAQKLYESESAAALTQAEQLAQQYKSGKLSRSAYEQQFESIKSGLMERQQSILQGYSSNIETIKSNYLESVKSFNILTQGQAEAKLRKQPEESQKRQDELNKIFDRYDIAFGDALAKQKKQAEKAPEGNYFDKLSQKIVDFKINIPLPEKYKTFFAKKSEQARFVAGKLQETRESFFTPLYKEGFKQLGEVKQPTTTRILAASKAVVGTVGSAGAAVGSFGLEFAASPSGFVKGIAVSVLNPIDTSKSLYQAFKKDPIGETALFYTLSKVGRAKVKTSEVTQALKEPKITIIEGEQFFTKEPAVLLEETPAYLETPKLKGGPYKSGSYSAQVLEDIKPTVSTVRRTGQDFSQFGINLGKGGSFFSTIFRQIEGKKYFIRSVTRETGEGVAKVFKDDVLLGEIKYKKQPDFLITEPKQLLKIEQTIKKPGLVRELDTTLSTADVIAQTKPGRSFLKPTIKTDIKQINLRSELREATIKSPEISKSFELFFTEEGVKTKPTSIEIREPKLEFSKTPEKQAAFLQADFEGGFGFKPAEFQAIQTQQIKSFFVGRAEELPPILKPLGKKGQVQPEFKFPFSRQIERYDFPEYDFSQKLFLKSDFKIQSFEGVATPAILARGIEPEIKLSKMTQIKPISETFKESDIFTPIKQKSPFSATELSLKDIAKREVEISILPDVKPTTKISQLPKQRQLPEQIAIPQLKEYPAQRFIPKTPGFPEPRSPKFNFGFAEPVKLLPLVPGIDIDKRKQPQEIFIEKPKKLRQPKGYLPTLTASFAGIFGKPQEFGVKSGLGIRPIPRGGKLL